MDETRKTLAEKLSGFAQTYLGGVCAVSLVLAASFSNYLNFNSYPLFTAEVGLALLILVVLSAFAALFYRFMGSLVRLAFVVLLSFLAIDLNFENQYAFFAAIIPVLILRDFTLPILGVVSATVLLSNTVQLVATSDHEIGRVIQTAERAESPNADAPALLHIILDAQIGPEGLVRSSDEAKTAGEIRRFFQDNGFRLFGGAYSVHRHTVNSIPAALNDNKDFGLMGSVRGRPVTVNRYFDYLQERGYQLRIYQTDWLKFCETREVRFCRQWPAADPKAMLETSLSAPDRAMILTSQFFNLSGIVLNLTIFYDNIAERARAYGIGLRPLLLQHKSWTSSLVAAHTFDTVIADLAIAQPGDAYFAHILLPHWPFSFEADCRLKSPRNWLDETAELTPLAERQAAYADQVRCTFKKFQQALDALRSSPAGGKSIVVVHGDHGSRIVDVGVRVENSDLFSDEDVIASYSTLFAVRAPELDAGYDRRRIPIHTLLSSFLKSGLTTIEGPMDADQRHWIVMEDEGWNSVGKRELPESWTGP